MNNTILWFALEVYPVRVRTVEEGSAATRSGGCSLSFDDKVLVPADSHFQNRLDVLFPYDREDDHLIVVSFNSKWLYASRGGPCPAHC